MFQQLIANLRSDIKFTEEEIIVFLAAFTSKTYRKNEIILKQGEISRNLIYINKGLVRYYYDTAHKEFTLAILNEDNWVTDYESFMTTQPSSVVIEALEDTEIYQITNDALQQIFAKGVNYERYGRLVAEKRFLDFVRREKIRKMKTPEERYLMLIDEFPDIVRRTPLKYIASMLGIEPETLSRIRKRISL